MDEALKDKHSSSSSSDENDSFQENGGTHFRFAGGIFISLAAAKLFFAAITLFGEVGQIIMYPLWLDVVAKDDSQTSGNYSSVASTNIYVPEFDCYSVLLCASVFEFILFFTLYMIFGRRSSIERSFPHKCILLVSVCNTANSILTAFTSSGTRTAPYLQTLLLNSYIPFTVLFRYLILKKLPNKKKAICVFVVVAALFVCLIPNFDTKLMSASSKDTGGAPGAGKVMWPLAFMLAIIPAVLMNIFQERYFKGEGPESVNGTVDIYYLNLWMSFYQLLISVHFFWLDLIPGFGTVNSLPHLFANLKFGFGCFFGQGGCGATPGVRGMLYVVSYVVSYLAGALLIKHGEGSTLWALVVNMVTPLTFLFWTLFDENPFKWDPEIHVSVAFSLVGLALMLPATIIYNLGEDDESNVATVPWVEDAELSCNETKSLLQSKGVKHHYV